jgi:hypothetical protein
MTSFEFDALVESTRSTDPDLFEAEATVDAIDEYLQHRAAEPTWRRRALDPEAEGVALQWRVGKDLSGYIRAQ